MHWFERGVFWFSQVCLDPSWESPVQRLYKISPFFLLTEEKKNALSRKTVNPDKNHEVDVIEANIYDDMNSSNLTIMVFATDKTTSLRDQEQIFAIDSTVLPPDLDFETNLLEDDWSITNTLIKEEFSLFSTDNDCSYIDTTDEADCVLYPLSAGTANKNIYTTCREEEKKRGL